MGLGFYFKALSLGVHRQVKDALALKLECQKWEGEITISLDGKGSKCPMTSYKPQLSSLKISDEGLGRLHTTQ